MKKLLVVVAILLFSYTSVNAAPFPMGVGGTNTSTIASGTVWSTGSALYSKSGALSNFVNDLGNYLGALLASNNLSDLNSSSTAKTNIGLGSDVIRFDNIGFNTFLGYQSGLSMPTSTNGNVFVGYQVAPNSTSSSASYNIGLGYRSLYGLVSGANNIAFGRQAGMSLIDGSSNLALGTLALSTSTTGNYNVAIGTQALQNNATGSANVAIGDQAGRYAVSSNELYIDNISQSNNGNEKLYSLMYGNFAGVAGTTTGQQLTVNGNLNVSNVVSSTEHRTPSSTIGTLYVNNLNVLTLTSSSQARIASATIPFAYDGNGKPYVTSTGITTSTGLSPLNFTSPNISQWTNDVPYCKTSDCISSSTASSTYLKLNASNSPLTGSLGIYGVVSSTELRTPSSTIGVAYDFNGNKYTTSTVYASSTWLKVANNGNDINSTSTFRGNLGMPIKAQWIMENPTTYEDDFIFTAYRTSTIVAVTAVNKTNSDTVTFNLAHATSRSQATSTANLLFASYQAVTATTTANCFAVTTTTSCSTGVFGTNASTTIKTGDTLRFITSAASSTQFGITIHMMEQ